MADFDFEKCNIDQKMARNGTKSAVGELRKLDEEARRRQRKQTSRKGRSRRPHYYETIFGPGVTDYKGMIEAQQKRALKSPKKFNVAVTEASGTDLRFLSKAIVSVPSVPVRAVRASGDRGSDMRDGSKN